jgi:hypothetical protein
VNAYAAQLKDSIKEYQEKSKPVQHGYFYRDDRLLQQVLAEINMQYPISITRHIKVSEDTSPNDYILLNKIASVDVNQLTKILVRN